MPPRPDPVAQCDIPVESKLDRGFVDASYYRDSYRTPLSRVGAKPTDLFFAIFGNRPRWMNWMMILRNKIVPLFGIEVASVAEIIAPQRRAHYSVGDKIGAWPIYSLTENELVVGRDNKHLDFRLSILRTPSSTREIVTVSTVCLVHNFFGKAYLFFVLPFHKLGVRLLIRCAAQSGRL